MKPGEKTKKDRMAAMQKVEQARLLLRDAKKLLPYDTTIARHVHIAATSCMYADREHAERYEEEWEETAGGPLGSEREG